VIVAFGPPTARAAKAATKTIPIVFTSGGDVVKSGLVSSLSRPGGNATGINLFTQTVEAKKLEQLSQLMPMATTIAFLLNPANPAADGKAKEMDAAARELGRQLHVVAARDENEIDVAFSRFAKLQVDAVVVGSDPFFNDSRRLQIVGLASRYAMPAIYGQREYVVDGGLISYGTSLSDAYRQAGIYAGAILNGENPATLPVLRPTRFELVINLKTAKTQGVTIPPTLLAIADEVIE
jgi:putative ABC transport system substrate-binding protein